MASAELTKYINDIYGMIEKTGKIEYEELSALYQATNVAMFTENDTEYGLKTINKTKLLINDLIKQDTHGEYNLWGVENICSKREQDTREIELYYDLLLFESFHNFQSFIFYLERLRKPEARFYYPRRKTLKIVVDDLSNLEDRKFEFYGLSMPARVGKSTTCILFLNWIMLKRPNSHNAMGGHSGELAKGFYKETKNLLTSKEYTFREMYEFWHPTSALIRETSAEGMSIILDKPDRFGTLTCRGIDGTWTGAVDISSDGYLYVDDLVKNREMSLSPQRMADCYQTYLNTMVDRKNDGARELMVGTLWNVTDPLERERVKHEGDPRYFFRRIPALNQNGRSNFDYELNGFSTQYYINLKNRLADAEWQAKYMQKPYVREGLLFDKNELRYFDGNIDSVINSDSPFRTVAVLDPAFGGGDSLSMPICRDYGDCNKFIIDWVFSNRTQKFTVPVIVKKIMQHGIAELQIETNSAGKLMVDSIRDEMNKQGCNFCKLTPVSAPVRMSKEDKIKGYSDYIKDNFVFLLPKDGKKVPTEAFIRSQEYEKAMDELGSYTSVGKNPHDDAPDSMAQMAMFFEKTRNGKIEIPTNPFRIGRMR